MTVALNPAKAITSFTFPASLNPALTSDLVASINFAEITATVPYGTNVTALVATFTTTGQSVTVGGVVQISGSTANNFTNFVKYTVHAADGTTQDYFVTITIASGAHKDLTSFAFLASENPTLASDVVPTISGTTLSATVPYGTNVASLVATFTTTGQSVTVGGVTQVSGTTANDFTNAVTYTVHALDGTTQDYTVTITVLGELHVTFAGNAAGEVQVFDLTTYLYTTCSSSCTVPLVAGDQIRVSAVSPSPVSGIAGACSAASSMPMCSFTAPTGASSITATFSTDPKELWTLLVSAPVIAVAHDSSGNVIVASAGGLTKLTSTGGLVWTSGPPVYGMATGPGDTIYARIGRIR